jgi:hypothetical protein
MRSMNAMESSKTDSHDNFHRPTQPGPSFQVPESGTTVGKDVVLGGNASMRKATRMYDV